jgi:hypothetical protein
MRGWLGNRHQRPPQPEGRPIEAIAADVRRLCARYHGLDPRSSYVKVEATRWAYDRVLGECCARLGRAHLLDVLSAGAELNAERERVEELLSESGVRLPHVV